MIDSAVGRSNEVVFGDPIDAACVRAATRKKLFGIDEEVRIGRLVIGERLGAGAMSVVYKAFDPELRRTVAVKLLQTSVDESRLVTEGRVLAKLRHDNVVAVHDVGTWEGRVFITMEHVPGGTLRTWLDAHPREWREVAKVLVQAARGIAAAHRAGVVHRDVKPDNILVGDDGEVRVADFGLARESDVDDGPAGTPAYVAPEVRDGAAGDARSDQFSFCVMAEAALGPRAPAHLARVVKRGRDPDPATRYESMDALVRAMEHDPARRWMISAAIVAGIAATATIAIAVWPSRDDGCAIVDELWTPAHRDRVEQALVAAPVPYARDVAVSVLAMLDRYASDWIVANRDACLDTHVRKTVSMDILDRRAACLARRRAAFQATIAMINEDGGAAAATAIARVEALPALDDCADLELLAAPTALPAEATTRARLVALVARLAAAEARATAGQVDPAIADTNAVIDDARALGYRPFVADALHARALMQRTRGDKPGAAATLREALAEAQASKHDGVVATAAIHLASVHSDAELARAEELLALAAATIERLGAAPRLLALYESAYGKLLYRAGKWADSVAHLESALTHEIAAGRSGTAGHAQLLTNLGGALAIAGREADAVPRLERALALREKLLGAGHPDVAETLNTLGITERRLGRADAALVRFDRARTIVEKLDSNEELLSMILDNRAGALAQLGRTAEAIADMRRAATLAESLLPAGDMRRAEVLINLADIESKDPAARLAAIATLDRALAIYAAAGAPDHPNAAIAILTRGLVRLDMGDRTAALADCRAAEAIGSKEMKPDHPIRVEMTRCITEAGAKTLTKP
ncbi:MAG: protein kinase domain-containing protein [Kofleriaceae bacterium]